MPAAHLNEGVEDESFLARAILRRRSTSISLGGHDLGNQKWKYSKIKDRFSSISYDNLTYLTPTKQTMIPTVRASPGQLDGLVAEEAVDHSHYVDMHMV